MSYSLSELDLSNNTGITGEIPSQLALLPRLQTVKLMQTNKSCAGIIKPYVSVDARAEHPFKQAVKRRLRAASVFQQQSSLPGSHLPCHTLCTLRQPTKSTRSTTPSVTSFSALTHGVRVCLFVLQTVTTNNSCNDPKRCHYPQQFGDLSAGIKKCAPDALLPCFLKFTDFYIPRDDDSNMRCKQIVRKPTEEARTDCAGPERLADQASAIPDKRWMARWEIDPSYYQYQACECLMVREHQRHCSAYRQGVVRV